MNQRLFVVITCWVTFALCPSLAVAQKAPTTTTKRITGTQFYQQAKAACVEILVDGRLSGSGWFATSDGYLFTAAHVVGLPGRRIEVLTQFGRHRAKVVAIDRGHDLALLRLTALKGETVYLKNAKRSSPPLSRIYTFGAPMFRHNILIDGMMARNDTTFEYYGDQKQYFEITQVSATILKGMSGGPWLNRKGEVVGLQSGVIFVNSTPASIGHIAPLSAIKRLLKTKKTTSTPTLGLAVEELWQQSHKEIRRFPVGTEGLVVIIINANGPAQNAGITKGDLIIAADGKKVRLPDELLRLVRAKKSGEKIQLTIRNQKDAKTENKSVQLGVLEEAWLKKMKK